MRGGCGAVCGLTRCFGGRENWGGVEQEIDPSKRPVCNEAVAMLGSERRKGPPFRDPPGHVSLRFQLSGVFISL